MPLAPPRVGQRVVSNAKDPATGLERPYLGTVRYVGEVAPTEGEWLGIEWDVVDSSRGRGKHSGTYDKTGVEYFQCTVPGTGSFLRPQALGQDYAGNSFWRAVERRYAELDEQIASSERTPFKVQVTDLSLVRQRYNQLDKLRDLGLEWQGVNGPGSEHDRHNSRTRLTAVKSVNLSFSQIATVESLADIVNDLSRVDTLYFNCNRVSYIDRPLDLPSLAKLRVLTLSRTLMQWNELARISSNLVNLTHLEFGDNPIKHLNAVDDLRLPKLELLNLEGCGLSNWQAVAATVAELPALTTLLLARNEIKDIPVNAHKLQLRHLSLSANLLSSWTAVDNIATAMLQLESLAVLDNPLYHAAPERDVRLEVIARLANLKTVDNSPVSAGEREDAELWYLARIGKEPASNDDKTKRHPRWSELIKKHGAELTTTSASKLKPQLIELSVVTSEDHQTPLSVKILPTAKTLQLRALVARAIGKPIPKNKFKLVAQFHSVEGDLLRVEIPSNQEGREVTWWGLNHGDSVAVESV
ncbi:hypothetical protein ACM66B_006502 [Microbotryomycetes sp. NB124-2]